MSNQNGRLDLDKLCRAEQSVEGLPALTPWDIGGPLPVAQEIVVYGALRGTVLALGPGTPRDVLCVEGFSVIGIDGSPAAIERAAKNGDGAARVDSCWTDSR